MPDNPSIMRTRATSLLAAIAAGCLLLAQGAAGQPPNAVKADAITLMNAFETTFFLDGKNRLAHDPYALHSAGIDKLQTESTAMALYYGGIDNLGLSQAELQEIYDFFAYMMDDGDDWMFNDYTVASGREYKKSLHVAWVLVALDMLIDRGISDSDDLLARSVDALEAGTDPSGYMSGDPASNESIRTKYVQSLPFFFKAALGLGDVGAIDAARRSIDFYMANCIDSNFDLWKVNASGTKTNKLVTHEMGEFAHGLYLFHQYESDAARKATIQSILVGILQRYTSSAWTHTNGYGEKYISNTGSAGTVNTLAQFQIQIVLALAAREGWVSDQLASEYFPIVDRIKITGTGDPERDNNYYYFANPDTGSALSSNINSYLPGYVIYAMDVQYLEIHGSILDGGGLPVPGVTLQADNGGFTATTDGNGDYVLSVPYDWTGTITPSKSGFTLSPTSSAHVGLIADVVGEDFTATEVGGLPTGTPPYLIKRRAIELMDSYETTFLLGGKSRTGYDPYAYYFAGKDKLQTESTAMALYYGGVENLELDSGRLQEIYDFFAYMMDDGDDWLYSDYTSSAGREYKKSLHTAWSLVALDILAAHGIPDVEDLIGRTVDALEAGTAVNGYLSGDPASNESIRTKYVQSLPFFFKAAIDLGDTGAIDAARRSVDFYMASCIDANYDLWKVNASGAKTSKLVSHEMAEFAHGLYLFHQYESDAARKATIQSNLVAILQRYTSSAWTHSNSFGEVYLSNNGAAGTVNTLAQFQIQFILALAAREGWVAPGLGEAYLPIADRIEITGTGDPERDHNFYYLANPETGSATSSNTNSYLPGYVIFAVDSQYVEISGTVLDEGGLPIQGALLDADNAGWSTTSDENGDYVISVPYGWSGSVTTSHPGIDFDPPTRAYTNVMGNVSGDDYAPAIPAVCGNGLLEPGETCDDGNTLDGDCCDAVCQVEPAGTCAAVPGLVGKGPIVLALLLAAMGVLCAGLQRNESARIS